MDFWADSWERQEQKWLWSHCVWVLQTPTSSFFGGIKPCVCMYIYIIYPSPIFIHRPWRQAVFRLWDLAVSGSISGAELQFVLTQAPASPRTVPGKPWNRKIHGESLWKNHGHRRKKDIFSKILRLSWYSWYRKSTLSWIQRQNRIGDGSKE